MRSFACLALATGLSLTACATGVSDDAALVIGYPPRFQAAVAAELAQMPPACQAGDPETPPGCSPLRTLLNDYKHLRDRLRVE
ncbi:MAG: hypothetical protein ACE5H8_02235 [Alphaproteobacteria bacterium]